MNQKSRVSRTVLLCGIAAATLAAAAGPKRAAPVRYGFPKIGPAQVWIASVPAGLDVVAGPEPAGPSLGKTPLVLDRQAAGAEVTVVLPKEKWGGELPIQTDFIDFTATTTHSTMTRNGAADQDVGRAITYRVDPARPTLIALFQSRSESLVTFSGRYPPGRNFTFRERTVRKDLGDRGVSKPRIDVGILLLRRGGKLALQGRDGWLVAEVRPDGSVSIADQPR